MNSKENVIALQEIKARIATQQKINRLLAFDPSETIWQETVSECTLEELEQAYEEIGDKSAWGSVAIKDAIDSRQLK